jgi:hypothetical protein
MDLLALTRLRKTMSFVFNNLLASFVTFSFHRESPRNRVGYPDDCLPSHQTPPRTRFQVKYNGYPNTWLSLCQ